MHFYNL